MSYPEHVTEDRRLRMLRTLIDQPTYTANEHYIRAEITALGHNVSRDRVRADIAWLDEQDLIISQEVSGMWLATLTARGEDVACGRVRITGVARPHPGE